MPEFSKSLSALMGFVRRRPLRFRYIHEPRGTHETSTLVWEGAWPLIDGQFPNQHPSHRYRSGFVSLIELGYDVIFPCEGDRCQLFRHYDQPKHRVLRNLDDCLGWHCISVISCDAKRGCDRTDSMCRKSRVNKIQALNPRLQLPKLGSKSMPLVCRIQRQSL